MLIGELVSGDYNQMHRRHVVATVCCDGSTFRQHVYIVLCCDNVYHLECGAYYLGGVVALSVEYRTCEREVVGSSLGRARGGETLGKFLTPVCLCSPNTSTSWYRPKGGDALRLGSKGRYSMCVGGR